MKISIRLMQLAINEKRENNSNFYYKQCCF